MNMKRDLKQCKCGHFFLDHSSGMCKVCRMMPQPKLRVSRKKKDSRSPIVGSAEWAETRGDDIPSLDQPGDDF